MLEIILIILLLLILLPLILIFLPLYYEIKYEYVNKLRYNLMFGFVFLKIRLNHTPDRDLTSIYFFNLRIYTFTDKKEKETELSEAKIKDTFKEKSKENEAKNNTNKKLLIFIKDNLSKIINLIKDLYDIFKPDNLYFHFLLGAYDPYYNGLLLAFYHTIKGSKPDFPVEIDIDWSKEVFNSRGEIKGSFAGFRIIWEALRFLIGTGLLKKFLISTFKGEKKWKKQKTSWK